MDETRRRRLSIARELAAWVGAIPRLLRKIDEVLKLPHVTEAQAVDIDSIKELIRTLILSIREAVDDEDLNRLSASIDRLREKISAADRTLDRLLKPKESN
jgi:phage terminase Nu1 subunit (DNA packaging protein)